ncbi:MAG: DUF1622 domain-containing protein [Eubacteriales bacterium]|nr:DUF1622 domain-containing protein [Eubacteriales bacterium]
MLENIVEQILMVVIPVCEIFGIIVVAVSAVSAFIKYVEALFGKKGSDIKFQLASGLALSLEFKMAAEILKTVLIREFSELMVLGAVIALRALLTFLIHFEMKQIEHK